MMPDKRPLSSAEYEIYLKKLIESYENKLYEQKERIFNLVEENKKLSNQLAELKSRDAQISKALMAAIAKAKEIEDAATAKYRMEVERLKLFHSKWIAYYAEIKSKLPITDELLAAESMLRKMDAILGLNSPIFAKKEDPSIVAQFLDENRRLEKRRLEEDSAATISPSGLDLNEVLNPKDLPRLEDLIREIMDRK